MPATVDGVELVFRYADPSGALSGVRLQQDVRLPGEALGFTHEDDAWVLRVPRPEVDRMEYSFELSTPPVAASGSSTRATRCASAERSATSPCC